MRMILGAYTTSVTSHWVLTVERTGLALQRPRLQTSAETLESLGKLVKTFYSDIREMFESSCEKTF